MNSHTLSINSKPFFPSMQSTSLDNHHENQNLGSNNIHHGNHTKAQSSSTLDQQSNNQEKLNKKQNRKKGNMKSEEMQIRNNELKESNMENANVINNISQNRKQSKRIKGTQNSQTPIPNHSFMTTTQTQSELANTLDRVHAHQYSQNFPSVNASISSTSSSTITPVPFSYKDILQSKTSGILTNSEILPQKSVVVAAHSNYKQQHISKQPVLDVINNNTINSSTPTPQMAATQTKELKSEKKANRKQLENAANHKQTALKSPTSTNAPTTPPKQTKLTKKQKAQLLINTLLQERKEFTLADHIGGDIDQLLKSTQEASSSSTTTQALPPEKTKTPKESPNKQGKDKLKKDATTVTNNKKSISKMNTLEKALLTKSDMKGRKPIRLEIYSDKVTNEDVYKAFMLAVNQQQTGHGIAKDTQRDSSTTNIHDVNGAEDMLVTVATKKKKPNKLKKIILKEKEIRKLQNLSPNDFIDIKKYLKKKKQEETTEEETDETDQVFVIEIEREKHNDSPTSVSNDNSDRKENEKTSNEQDTAHTSQIDNKEDVNDNVNKESESDSESVISETESMNIVLKGANERKIREYVPYPLDPVYENCVFQMLAKLQFYQHRLKKTDKKKFKARRRYVIGIREVLKGLKIKEIRAVVIAPNIDKITTPGGLDSKIEEIIQKCNEMELPVFFALTKKKLGIALKTSTKLSVIGLYSMDGAFDEFKKAKAMIEEKLALVEEQKKKDNSSQPTTTITSSE